MLVDETYSLSNRIKIYEKLSNRVKKPMSFGNSSNIKKSLNNESRETAEVLCSKCGTMVALDIIGKSHA